MPQLHKSTNLFSFLLSFITFILESSTCSDMLFNIKCSDGKFITCEGYCPQSFDSVTCLMSYRLSGTTVSFQVDAVASVRSTNLIQSHTVLTFCLQRECFPYRKPQFVNKRERKEGENKYRNKKKKWFGKGKKSGGGE